MRRLFVLLLLLAAPLPAGANDGYAGLGAGGLEFGQSEHIRMLSEELHLSRSAVRVDYRFRNEGPADETVLVAFQLPPVAPADLESGMALPEVLWQARTLDYLDFTATVDGWPVALRREARYFLPNPEELSLWGLAALEAPGPDVTQRLLALGVPETYDPAILRDWFQALPAKERKALLAEGIFEMLEGGPTPRYFASLRFWWEQDFPAGRTLAIAHAYTPVLGASIYYVSEQMTEDFCIDAGTRKAMDRVAASVEGKPDAYVLLTDLQYVLRTAGTWKGPIGRFRLTLDKEDPKAIVSLCATGLTKTSPTTFVLERSDYVPAEDLRVLFTAAMGLE